MDNHVISDIQLAADFDRQEVEIHFGSADGSVLTIRLAGRGIFQLRDEIDGLLSDRPQIHNWKNPTVN